MNLMTHQHRPPNALEADVARATSQTLSRYARGGRPFKLLVTDQEREEPIELPAGAVEMLLDILKEMAAGNGVTIMPVGAELTTVQAAELLNVSRPYLIKLIDEGKIKVHRMVGAHRRLKFEDVMAYKEKTLKEREALFDEMSDLTQELAEKW